MCESMYTTCTIIRRVSILIEWLFLCTFSNSILQTIKREETRNPLSSSATIYQSCNLPGVSGSTRRQMLTHGQGQESLNTTKTEDSQVEVTRLGIEILYDRFFFFIDFMKRWSEILMEQINGLVAGSLWLMRQQSGGGVQVWAAIIKD